MVEIITRPQIKHYLSEHGITDELTQLQDLSLAYHGNSVEWREGADYYRLSFNMLGDSFTIEVNEPRNR